MGFLFGLYFVLLLVVGVFFVSCGVVLCFLFGSDCGCFFCSSICVF